RDWYPPLNQAEISTATAQALRPGDPTWPDRHGKGRNASVRAIRDRSTCTHPGDIYNGFKRGDGHPWGDHSLWVAVRNRWNCFIKGTGPLKSRVLSAL